jgi:hypothetical protein
MQYTFIQPLTLPEGLTVETLTFKDQSGKVARLGCKKAFALSLDYEPDPQLLMVCMGLVSAGFADVNPDSLHAGDYMGLGGAYAAFLEITAPQPTLASGQPALSPAEPAPLQSLTDPA